MMRHWSNRLQTSSHVCSDGPSMLALTRPRSRPVPPVSFLHKPYHMRGQGTAAELSGRYNDFLLTMNMKPEEAQPPSSEPPSDRSSTTGILSQWIQVQRLNRVDPTVTERAKYIILDGLACAILAAQLPESQVAAKSVFGMEGSGKCTVVGWNKCIGPLAAALLNSTFIQGFEIDDVHREAPWHANSIILPALFAAVEHCPKAQTSTGRHTGESFLTSALIGFELGGRVGRSLSGKEMLSRGWHSGAVFGPAAAAASVARQLNLSPRQTEDALGTACTQACGLMSAQYGAMAKRMQHGFAARNGLFAALTARDNYTGIDRVFEQPYGGYLSVFGQGSSQSLSPAAREDLLVDQLGTDWTALEGICPKPYASMVGTHGAIDCIRKLQDQETGKLKDLNSIKSIKVELNEAWFHHSGQDISNPITVCGAQMSTKYCVATQLIDKDVLPAQFTESKLHRDDIWHVIDKVSCFHDTRFDHDHPKANPTRVTIEFDDGSVLVEETLRPSTTSTPMSNQDIRKKWRTMMSSCIDDERTQRIEDMVLNLEKLDDVTDLIRALGPETRCPI